MCTCNELPFEEQVALLSQCVFPPQEARARRPFPAGGVSAGGVLKEEGGEYVCSPFPGINIRLSKFEFVGGFIRAKGDLLSDENEPLVFHGFGATAKGILQFDPK
jgi:hypothetical protein